MVFVYLKNSLKHPNRWVLVSFLFFRPCLPLRQALLCETSQELAQEALKQQMRKAKGLGRRWGGRSGEGLGLEVEKWKVLECLQSGKSVFFSLGGLLGMKK